MAGGFPLTPEGLRSRDRIPRFPSTWPRLAPSFPSRLARLPFRYGNPAAGFRSASSRPSRRAPLSGSRRVDRIAFEPGAGSLNAASMRPLATSPRLRWKPKAPIFKKLPADRSVQRPAGGQGAEVLHSWREVQGAKGPGAGARALYGPEPDDRSGLGVAIRPRSRIRHASCSAPRRRSPRPGPVAGYRAPPGPERSRAARFAGSQRLLRRTRPR